MENNVLSTDKLIKFRPNEHEPRSHKKIAVNKECRTSCKYLTHLQNLYLEKVKSFYQHDNGIIYSQCIDICAEIYSPCIDICAEEYHFDDNVKNNDFIEMLPQI